MLCGNHIIGSWDFADETRSDGFSCIFSLLVGCSESVVPSCFKEKISQFDDVDAFVCWLEAQPGVTEVSVNKKLLMTSAPPQVVVSFLLDGSRRTLPLLVEPDRKLKLVSPE